MNSSHGDVIIIRGAPGSGKTETSKCLAAHFPKGIRLEVDKLRAMVISVDWTDQDEHINILSLSTNLVLGFLKLGYRPVIVVDTFSGDKLVRFLAELQVQDKNLAVISYALVTAPNVLKVRIENRSADQFRDIGICQNLNSDVMKYLLPNEQLIDTTDLTPEATAKEILERLLL